MVVQAMGRRQGEYSARMSANTKISILDRPRIGYLISIISVAVNICLAMYSYTITQRSSKQQPEPKLSCVLDKDPAPPPYILFTLTNDGPISVSSVVVDCRTLQYVKADHRIGAVVTGGGAFPRYEDQGKRWLIADLLKPNEAIHKLTGESADPDGSRMLNILQFSIDYYRDADGQEFHKQCLYFVEGQKVMSVAKFRGDKEYPIVIGEIARIDARRQLEPPVGLEKE